MNKTCENCKFRLPDEDDYSICLRYPPVDVLDAKATMVSQFPLVKNHWWCGEWKPKEEGASDGLCG